MKLKISKKWFTIEYLWFYTIIILYCIKLTFSYLDVEIGWWGKQKEQVTNYERYNFFGLPQNFSGILEYGILPLLIIYVSVYFKLLGRFKVTYVLVLFLLLLNIITFFFTPNSIIESIKYSFKIIGPILFFLSILIFSKRNKDFILKKTMFKLFKYCGLLTVIGFFAFDYKIRLDAIALPVYFGNLHNQSYILAIIFIGISLYYYKKISIVKLLLFYSVTVLFLYFGYTVRTALIVYLIFITATLFLRSNLIRGLIVLGTISLPFVLLIVIYAFNIDLDSFASGRLSMYEAKYEMLKASSVTELLFGHGAGTDFISIKIWAGARGSHNDYLTYLVENGLIFMVTFIILLLSLIPAYKKINLIYLSLIFGYLFSSAVSNGIAVRPLVGYLFFMVLAFIYLKTWGVKEGWINKKQNAV